MNDGKITAWRHPISGVHVYEVMPHELDTVEKESLDLGQDFQFGLCSLSIFGTLFVALLLTEIKSPKLYASFVAATILFGVFSLFFLSKYFRARKSFKSTIQTIRERQVGPLGEEGRELRPAEVAQLPVAAAETIATFTADAVLVKAEDAGPRVLSATSPPAEAVQALPTQTGGEK